MIIFLIFLLAFGALMYPKYKGVIGIKSFQSDEQLMNTFINFHMDKRIHNNDFKRRGF